jgi:DNA invertase Pin-like site-specific DNA recombinase
MLIGDRASQPQDQSFDLQIEALTKAGCQKTFGDKTSGSRAERPGLTQALSSQAN